MRKTDPLPALTVALILVAAALLRAFSAAPRAAPEPPPLWRPDINRSPPRHLILLPGIGPVRARAIAEERRRAVFAGIDDLHRVHGIGPATVAMLRDVAVARP